MVERVIDAESLRQVLDSFPLYVVHGKVEVDDVGGPVECFSNDSNTRVTELVEAEII